MKKLTYLFLLLMPLFVAGQDVGFYGEGSPTNVRLVWYPYSWPAETDGAYIKRRPVGTNEWTALNNNPIVPGMGENIPLNDRIKDEKLLEKITERRRRRMIQKKWKTVSPEDFKQVLIKGDKNKWMQFGFREEYFLAVASGFGFIDAPDTKNKKYEYGIFFSKAQKEPTKTVEVELVDPEYAIKITSKPKFVDVHGRMFMHLYWYIDSVDYYNNFYLNQFIGYKKEPGSDRKSPLHGANIKPGKLADGFGVRHENLDIDKENTITYVLKVITIFDTYHDVATIDVDPSDIPPENLYLKLEPINDDGYDLSKGLPPIQWNFHQEDEKHIDGFIVQEDVGMRDWETVSDTLSPSQRTFTYPKKPINKKEYTFRIMALRSDGMRDQRSVNVEDYYYRYVPKAPAPELQYEWIENEGGKALRIFWTEDNKAPGTVGYRLLYNWDDDEEDYRCPRDGRLLETPEYYYDVNDPFGRYYYFKVAQISADDDIGAWSAPLQALTHTTEMPVFQINDVRYGDKKVTVEWSKWLPVNDLKDFDAFYVYVDDELIGKHPIETYELTFDYKKKGKHTIKVIGKTQFGLSVEDEMRFTVEK